MVINYYTLENQKFPDYGIFYNYFKAHDAVNNFMFHFHGFGAGERKSFCNQEGYNTLISIYSFWRERGFLTTKQISLAHRLIQKFIYGVK